MRPLDREAGFTYVVRHVLVARHRILVAGIERTAVTIALLIIGCCRESPRALSIDFTQEFKVDLVVDGKIVAAITQIEATRRLVTISRHDDTRRVALGEGEKAIGNSQRQRHIGHHEIGGTEDDILARTDFGSRQGEIEVGVWLVAGGVASVIEIHIAVGITLRYLRGHVTFILLGIDILDETLLRLEVESHRVGFVSVATHLEYRGSVLLTRCVARTGGMDQTGIHRHVNLVALQVHILILHVRLAIKEGEFCVAHIYQ